MAAGFGRAGVMGQVVVAGFDRDWACRPRGKSYDGLALVTSHTSRKLQRGEAVVKREKKICLFCEDL